MENIYVRDYQDLLDGNILAPIRMDAHYNEVGDDYEGPAYLAKRHNRIVYISGGTFTRAYGGPEEGGWYYDAFDPQIEFAISVKDEVTLRLAISNIESLLLLRNPDLDLQEMGIYLRSDDFHNPGRPHYE
jgi:hypothetical protein